MHAHFEWLLLFVLCSVASCSCAFSNQPRLVLQSFTKYCQVVHYREFSSDEEQEEDEEELSSLLSGIPEEEEEAARSSGGSMGGGGREEEEWQWEDEMMTGLASRPANARV